MDDREAAEVTTETLSAPRANRHRKNEDMEAASRTIVVTATTTTIMIITMVAGEAIEAITEEGIPHPQLGEEGRFRGETIIGATGIVENIASESLLSWYRRPFLFQS